MNYAIFVSKKDPAGMNIRNCLLKNEVFVKAGEFFDSNDVYRAVIGNNKIGLYTLEKETVFSDGIDESVKEESIIFATRHQSSSKRPSFSVHTPGNFGTAEYGGVGSEICVSNSILMKSAFLALLKNAKGCSHEVTLEATHHGPFLKKPVMFIEIGSSIEEWTKEKNGYVIARTLLEIFRESEDGVHDLRKVRSAIGFGGMHYCSNFNRVEAETDIVMGHICPKYALGNLNENMVLQMIEKDVSKVGLCLLDWKGLGKEKRSLLDILDSMGLEYKKTKDVL